MIAVDTNVLVHADRADSKKHAAARAALEALAGGAQPWGLPVFVIGEFLRVVTNPAAWTRPTPLAEALDEVDNLLASPTARLLTPASRFVRLFRSVAMAAGASGNRLFDAQIAAVCLEQGATVLLTEDRDFDRFPGLTVRRLGP